MHQGEVVPDEELVRRLLASQFPQWSELPLAPVTSAGTDNALYRLGDELVVRLPRLAPHLPLAVRDRSVRAAIEAIGGINEPGFDAAAATEAWESSLRAPVWAGPPTWLHGYVRGPHGPRLALTRQVSLA